MPANYEIKIDWASYKATKYACENWHYSKSVPAGKIVKIGIWEKGVFIGVVLFSRGANSSIGKPYALEQDEVCELTRVALNKHITPVSYILSRSLKSLKDFCPDLRLVVSYADCDQNHHGGIYQATNWIYEGRVSIGKCSAFIIHGKKVHTRTVGSKGIKSSIDSVRQYLDPNAECFVTLGKHKYLMPLDRKMRRQIKHLSKPYPKRQ